MARRTGPPVSCTSGRPVVATQAFTYYTLSDKAEAHPLSGAPVNAGGYFFVATYAGNGNYLPTRTTSGPIVITKAAAVINASDLGGAYNGKPMPATGFVYVGTTPVATPVFNYYLLSDKSESHPLSGASKWNPRQVLLHGDVCRQQQSSPDRNLVRKNGTSRSR